MDDEATRMEAVRRYDVLDTPADGAFDRITALAAKHFDVPISIVSIVDTDRIWFKSHHGLPDVQEIGREPGLCASAILGDGPWIVENAPEDPRALANPLVAGEVGLRFYAGAPLTTRDGHNLGTLCVIDQQPREFSAEDAETLTDIAGIVVDELELRLGARQAVDKEQALRDQARSMARSLQQSLLPPTLPSVPGAQIAALYRPSDPAEVGGDFYDVFELPTVGTERWAFVVGDVSGKGPEAAAVTALARHSIRTASLSAASPSATLQTLNQAMLLGQAADDFEHFCTVLVVFAERTPDGLALTAAGAGHPPGIILRADGTLAELAPTGTPVGWRARTSFVEAAAVLNSGDALVLYTDGITEARTGSGFFEPAGLLAALEACGPASAEDLVSCVGAALDSDDVDVRDDAATLVVRID